MEYFFVSLLCLNLYFMTTIFYNYILTSIFFISTVVFIILFIKSRISYKKLLRTNLHNQEKTFRLVNTTDFNSIKSYNHSEENILQNMRQLFEEEEIFLNPDLTIQDLAKQLGSNKTTISHIINSQCNKNFSTLVNEYRINKAIELLTDKNNYNYSIEAIGGMCGFKNRQVFHSVFKKEIGITPRRFLEISQEKN